MTEQELLEFNKGREIQQIGIVVADLEDAIERWQTAYRVGPWRVSRCSSDSLSLKVRKDDVVREQFCYRLATAMVGALQIELIEANPSVPIYYDFLEKTGGGLHHVREKIPDENMSRELDFYRDKGMPVTFGGNFRNVSFWYVDSVPELGIQLEFSNGAKLE